MGAWMEERGVLMEETTLKTDDDSLTTTVYQSHSQRDWTPLPKIGHKIALIFVSVFRNELLYYGTSYKENIQEETLHGIF